MDLRPLALQQPRELRGQGGALAVVGDDPGGRALGPRLGDGSLRLQGEIAHELLAVVGHVLEREQQGALLHVDIVAQRPLDLGQRRVGAVPGARGRGVGELALAGVGPAVAERLVEAADRVVAVGDVEHVVRGPAVVEPVRPDPRHAAPGHPLDLVVRELLPLADDDGVEPGVIGAGAGRGVEVRHGLVQVVEDLRVPFQKGLHHHIRQRQCQAHRVAVVVVGHVLAPVHQPRRLLARVRLAVAIDVDHPVPAVDLHDGCDQDDQVLADRLDVCRVFDGEPVGQLHEHLGRAGLRRVDRAGEPVERLGLAHQVGRLGVRRLAGVGELRGDLFVAVDPPEVLLARDGREDHLAALLALADGPHLDPRGRRGERAEVGVDVLRVRELLGRADDIAQRLLRRGDGVRRGQVVDELGEEERLGRVLADLRGVVGVDRLRRRIVGPAPRELESSRPVRSHRASVRSVIRVVPSNEWAFCRLCDAWWMRDSPELRARIRRMSLRTVRSVSRSRHRRSS